MRNKERMRDRMNEVEDCQRSFFDKYAESAQWKNANLNSIFRDLALAELHNGFMWLTDCRRLLDYGCGVGEMIEEFSRLLPGVEHEFIGVDISAKSVDICRSRFKGSYYVISHNKAPEIYDSSVDAVYIAMVLHHATNHAEIFREVRRILRPGGKLFVVDLTDTNPIINLGRAIFRFLPASIKMRFTDDLVVGNEIPEKMPVKVNNVLSNLREQGFEIEDVERGHLFFFLLDWADKVLNLKIGERFPRFVLTVYRIEKWLLRFPVVAYFSHVFAIKAILRDA